MHGLKNFVLQCLSQEWKVSFLCYHILLTITAFKSLKSGLISILAIKLLLISQVNLQLLWCLPFRALIISGTFFFIVEFQWFFIELSVRPGSILVIYAHLLPCAICARNKIHYYSNIHSDLRIEGFKWLCHLSRHCFPRRPGTNFAMNDHLWGPYFSTSFLTRLS